MAKKSCLQLLALGLALLLMVTAVPLRAFGDEPAAGQSGVDAPDTAGLSGLEMAMWLQPCSVEATIALDESMLSKGDPMVTVKLERLDDSRHAVWTDYQTVRMAGGSTVEKPYWNSLRPGLYRLSLLPVLRYRLEDISELEAGTRRGSAVEFSLAAWPNPWKFEGRARFALRLAARDWMSDTDRVTNLVVPTRRGGGSDDHDDD